MRWSNSGFTRVSDGQLLMQMESNESPVILFFVCVRLSVNIILERGKHSQLLLLFSLTVTNMQKGNNVKGSKRDNTHSQRIV